MPISYIETASLDTALNAPTATALSTASGSAPSYSARAWVNFNGTGTVAIRASGNVTSITDNGTGDYTVNFTNALPDVNYAFTGTLAAGSASTVVCVAENSNTTRTASLFRIYTSQQGAILIDAPAVMISVFR